MYVIVGLGNPGLSYKKTRHNAGFMALDVLAKRHGIKISTKGFSSLYADCKLNGQRCILLKPQTYMNLSGDAVGQLMRYFKLPPQSLVVLYDDIELPLGKLRIRDHGSGGTHNGMKSIVSCLGSHDFARVRIGLGKDESLLLMDYVLKAPSKAEMGVLKQTFEDAATACELIIEGRLTEAQARFN